MSPAIRIASALFFASGAAALIFETLWFRLAGLALGLSVAVVAEYARDCYRTASDLADVMAVPVLGSIGTIVTRIEARRRFVRRATVGLSTLVIVAGLGWMTWMWHATPERLPLTMLEAIESFRLMLM